jgi:hypothetical protein
MKIKTQFYPAFFIIGIIILLITSVLIVTHWIITENIESQIGSKLNQFEFYIESIKNQTMQNKINYCKTIANNENLISAVENKDSEAIHSIMQTTYNIANLDYFLVTDGEGKALIKSEINNITNDYFLFPGVFSFLSKINPTTQNYITWSLTNSNTHYIICAVPIMKKDKTIGTLNIGYLVNGILKIESSSDIEYAIINGKEVLQSTSNFQQELIEEFLGLHKPIIDAVLATSRPSDMFSTTFNETEVYSKILPFGSGVPVLMLVSVSKSNEFLFLNTLFEYLIYIFIVFSLMLLITYFVIVNRKTKLIDKLNSAINNLSEKQKVKKEPEKTEEKVEQEIIEPDSYVAEVVKDLKGTVLISKIVCFESETEDSLIGVIESYKNIQTELIELYDGKVEMIIDNKLIASFSGNENSIDKSIQCSLAIMKLINKEAESSKCKIAIGLNYGSIIYENQENPELFGKTLELTEAIVHVSKPGQILAQANQVAKIDMNISGVKSRVWKFKNFKDEVRLVDLGLK